MRSELDRNSADTDRGAGADERTQAEDDRNAAGDDRRSSAMERYQANIDRHAAAEAREAASQGRAAGTSGGLSFRPSKNGVQLGLLGSFSLHIDAEPVSLPMNAQRLICFLALHDGLLQRQHVAGSLWGETTERRAGGSLRSALWRLGHPTYPLVEAADAHLRLSPSVAVDLRQSEALAHRLLDGSKDVSDNDMDAALLSVELLPDWTDDWVLVKREHHRQLRLRALETLSRRLRDMGRFSEAVQAGILAVAGEPLRESAQRTLIVSFIAEGNVSGALRQYDCFRELLRDELGLDPSPDLQALVGALYG